MAPYAGSPSGGWSGPILFDPVRVEGGRKVGGVGFSYPGFHPGLFILDHVVVLKWDRWARR